MKGNETLYCYKFEYSVPRYGTLAGLFLSFDKIKESTKYNEVVYFDEELGKHTEFSVCWKDYLQEINLTQECMQELKQTFGMSISGIYLPDYLDEK